MIEWIVLIWTATCFPASSFECNSLHKIDRVYVSSSITQFEQKFNCLSGKERETARIFRGNEFVSNTALTIKVLPSKTYRCFHDNVDMIYIGDGKWKCPKSSVISENNAEGVPKLSLP